MVFKFEVELYECLVEARQQGYWSIVGGVSGTATFMDCIDSASSPRGGNCSQQQAAIFEMVVDSSSIVMGLVMVAAFGFGDFTISVNQIGFGGCTGGGSGARLKIEF
ncbi:hypothetical protein DFA_12207 [Cavenderia fasciculata]|uniref:Uncharacterized protein n=1 Tax=Cavenderia fasciculata TaxID=261658 RepID=F4QCK7_CACFS|nr:uncharacterized protein DFA_12207 [Cavenderia fasciculata]EGG14435.1 hypothetical protein DFA_12207 [Cavenderia fasciculata]|eukprot:XP_004353844.1 hypothetical protein DFA_12207 [Cavenderia fasciculata]